MNRVAREHSAEPLPILEEGQGIDDGRRYLQFAVVNWCRCSFQTERLSAREASPRTARSGENEDLVPKPCVVARTRQGIGGSS